MTEYITCSMVHVCTKFKTTGTASGQTAWTQEIRILQMSCWQALICIRYEVNSGGSR